MVEVTDAELDRLVEQLGAIIPLLDGLETGQDCADYAFAKSNGFQAMTYCPDAFEALRSVPEAATAITTLRARIAEDQAQIAALTTYRENLRDEVIELRARIAELEAFQQQAIKQVCELAREAGEAKGKLEASELPGIVDGWREKCERLERRVAELEACIDLVIPDDCKSQLHEDATNMVKLQARVAELEADRAEWVEVERLRMGKLTPPTPPA